MDITVLAQTQLALELFWSELEKFRFHFYSFIFVYCLAYKKQTSLFHSQTPPPPQIQVYHISDTQHHWNQECHESLLLLIVWRDAAQELEKKQGVRNRPRFGDNGRFRHVQFVSDVIHKTASLCSFFLTHHFVILLETIRKQMVPSKSY